MRGRSVRRRAPKRRAKAEILINASREETRIALLEDDEVREYYQERVKDKGIVGNIYKGRVMRVLPGMQAAFLDLGLEKAAFLYVDDIVREHPEFEVDVDEEEEEEGPETPASEVALADHLVHPEGDPHGAGNGNGEGAAAAPSEEPDEEDEEEEGEEEDAAAEGASEEDEEEAAAEAAEAEEGGEAPAAAAEAAPAAPAPKAAAKRPERPRQAERRGQVKRPTSRRKAAPGVSIDQLLKPGQEVLVQIAKEPMGTKGARITSHISLPGRYLVFMPTIDTVGISRRIESEQDRRRLKRIVHELKPEGAGFIIRTAAAGVSDENIQEDIQGLLRMWKKLQERYAEVSAPAVVHEELDLAQRVLRDVLSPQVGRIVVDDKPAYEQIVAFLQEEKTFNGVVELYQGRAPLFEHYGVEVHVDEALGRKVWLKSGGYLIIEHTEALTAVDVNTGKFVGKRNQEETILKTNLEAVDAVVAQLRLRNIGGIIILDLIDMESAENRDRVHRALSEAMRRDKARSTVSRISELGLVEMTRKRTRESLENAICEPCPHCEGRGVVKSRRTVAYEIFRELRRELRGGLSRKKLKLRVHPTVADALAGAEKDGIEEIEATFKKKIEVEGDPLFHHEQFEIG